MGRRPTTTSTTSTTTTTTTEAPVEEEEYDDDEEEEVLPYGESIDEEDPQVIKELIDLIKKVGGLDELEKQLRLRLTLNEKTSSNQGTTTMSPISQSLYEKVLNNAKTINSSQGREFLANRQNKESKYSSVIRNSRPGPQNYGIDKLPEFEGMLKERPKYVTIQRTQAPKNQQQDDDDEEEEEEEEIVVKRVQEDDEDVHPAPKFSSSSQPQYVNIRRNRPSTAEPVGVYVSNQNEDENRSTTSKATYVSINRSRPTKVEQDEEDEAEKKNAQVSASIDTRFVAHGVANY